MDSGLAPLARPGMTVVGYLSSSAPARSAVEGLFGFNRRRRHRLSKRDKALDISLRFDYIGPQSISLEEGRLSRRYSGMRERVRCPRAGGYGPLPGGTGISLPAL